MEVELKLELECVEVEVVVVEVVLCSGVGSLGGLKDIYAYSRSQNP